MGSKDDRYPLEFETFRAVGAYEVTSWTDPKPSCVNGWVRVQRYRVRVEVVDEPIEVIHERLQTLWEHTRNHHHREPLLRAAKKHGYEFKGHMGAKVK